MQQKKSAKLSFFETQQIMVLLILQGVKPY